MNRRELLKASAVAAVSAIPASVLADAGIEIDDSDVVRLEPGDIFIIKVPLSMNVEMFTNLRSAIRNVLPEGVKTLILDVGMDFGVVKTGSVDG